MFFLQWQLKLQISININSQHNYQNSRLEENFNLRKSSLKENFELNILKVPNVNEWLYDTVYANEFFTHESRPSWFTALCMRNVKVE